MNKPLNRLRHHVTGAIERGEAVAIVERTVGNSDPVAEMMAEHRKVLAERDELVAALAQIARLASEGEVSANMQYALGDIARATLPGPHSQR